LKRALAVILSVLIADQVLKVWVKLTFLYDTAIPLFGNHAFLHFIENRGMAFGLEFGGEWGKLLLTLLRIVAVGGIGYALLKMTRTGASSMLVFSVALIFAGALGNIIDSTFYGVLFSESTPFRRAIFLPPGGGYAPLLHGAVVDMFYFPLWEGRLPEWMPIWGGEHMVFFRPVFNIADAAITVGVALFILVQRPHVAKPEEQAAMQVTEGDLPTAPETPSQPV
jgi:signal peptidase II